MAYKKEWPVGFAALGPAKRIQRPQIKTHLFALQPKKLQPGNFPYTGKPWGKVGTAVKRVQGSSVSPSKLVVVANISYY